MNNKIGRNDQCPCNSGLKYKHCHKGKIFTLKSDSFVVTAKHNNKIYKLFRIKFHQRKNTKQASIIISFPYYKKTNGLVSLVTFPKNRWAMPKLSMIPGGKVTSQRIKYSHWHDGNVHFSEDGRIFTFKKDPSDSLDKSIGHIFTAQFKKVDDFEEKIDLISKPNKDRILEVEIEDIKMDTLKFTGWWYNSNIVHPNRETFSQTYHFIEDDGSANICFALQPPEDTIYSDKILFLCVRKEFMTKEKGSHVFFMGGFDQREKSLDINNDIHFLTMKYPARSYEKLKSTLGTIDYIPQTTDLIK